MGYIAIEELKDLIDSENIEGKSEASLQLLIDSGKELIDGYCRREFIDQVPSIVKVVNAELVSFMLNDATKDSESIDGYSFKNNPKAYEHILGKLSNFVSDSAGWPQKRNIKAMVI